MDKPYLTFEQQIEKLKNEYGLIIKNDIIAMEALSSISYYDLINGYKSIYMKQDKYITGITIEDLITMHIYNKNIQGILMKYSTYVENSFKTLFAHALAASLTEHEEKYLDVTMYARPRTLQEREILRDFFIKLKSICTTTLDQPTLHYRQTKDHVPPWILLRNITFSNTTQLFKASKSYVKKSVYTYLTFFSESSYDYEKMTNITISALRHTRKFRNSIAHNLNFLSYRGSNLNKEANKMFKNTLVSPSEESKTFDDVWGFVLSMVILLNNKSLVIIFLTEFQRYMNASANHVVEYCKATGIPLDYSKRIDSYIATITR